MSGSLVYSKTISRNMIVMTMKPHQTSFETKTWSKVNPMVQPIYVA